MVVIKGVKATSIKDSRGEKTIFVKINTDAGVFSSSAPNGKSTGKFEAKSYKNSLEGDIGALNDFSEYFTDDILEKFEDLRRIEDIVEGHVGANSMFALESAVLKAMAKEQKKEVWQLINPKARKLPRLVGNCVGGGKHSKLVGNKKPDFQEFLLIPKTKTIKEAFEENKELKKKVETSLNKADDDFSSKKNDENAWMVSLNDKQVLDVLNEFKVDLGIDVAASGFCKRKKYQYENPRLKREVDEQLGYLSNLIKNYPLIYIEDPFDEADFESFAKLQKKFPDAMVVGDDLTVTNHARLLEAIEKKSISGIIVKPNQNGSLLSVKQVVETAKDKGIKIIFSHRSGETEEDILADLAFGFQADFFKCGIDGKEREAKLRRMIEIERSFK